MTLPTIQQSKKFKKTRKKGGTKLKKKRDYVGYLMYFLKILVPAIVAVFILRGFFLIPVRVDGHSMQKTLNQGDMIVMEKFSAIKRFDVVVFKTDTGSILIKRVIGLPGEAVRYENDQLYVNNQPIAEPYLTKNRKKIMKRCLILRILIQKNC